MDRAADFLRRAEEAELKAAQAPDAKARRQSLNLASTWRDLARNVGGPVRTPPPDESP
jgi:NAD-dependent oxidoreductase involved in siderophore biosynthesis